MGENLLHSGNIIGVELFFICPFILMLELVSNIHICPLQGVKLYQKTKLKASGVLPICDGQVGRDKCWI